MKNKKAQMDMTIKFLLWAVFFALLLFGLYLFLGKLGVI